MPSLSMTGMATGSASTKTLQGETHHWGNCKCVCRKLPRMDRQYKFNERYPTVLLCRKHTAEEPGRQKSMPAEDHSRWPGDNNQQQRRQPGRETILSLGDRALHLREDHGSIWAITDRHHKKQISQGWRARWGCIITRRGGTR